MLVQCLFMEILKKNKYDENLELKPKSCYGISKLASENYLKIFSKKKLII